MELNREWTRIHTNEDLTAVRGACLACASQIRFSTWLSYIVLVLVVVLVLEKNVPRRGITTSQSVEIDFTSRSAHWVTPLARFEDEDDDEDEDDIRQPGVLAVIWQGETTAQSP